jgi:hypothetical protein
MSTALSPNAYFANPNNDSSSVTSAIIVQGSTSDGGGTSSGIFRRQESSVTSSTRPEPTSVSTTSVQGTTSPTVTAPSNPTPTSGFYRGFDTSYSGWIFANDLFLARYSALNVSNGDVDFATNQVDYGSSAVNPMNMNGSSIGTINNMTRGTTVWSSTVGSNVKFTFTGTQLFLFAPISNRPGSAVITIDNLPPTVINLEIASNFDSDVPIVQQMVYESKRLDHGFHQVGLTVVSGQFLWDFVKYVVSCVSSSTPPQRFH